MTLLASRELEQAILTVLKGNEDLIALLSGVRLYDEPKRNSPFPYLTLTTTYSRDWSTGTEQGDEHRVAITVWTGSEDRLKQQKIFALLRSLLLAPDVHLPMTGHALINLQIERQDWRPDRKNHLLQGIMQIRAVTEALSN
ncbi:DUF3168 domain-containing protein [uncultured Cohaesibacter sp.]|uniref:DUF3168 domain-containing protein n=1 Tax=uncultured Cohaesibacter sp. TaxID=1002546 RepID=UPI0029C710F8|nr:DUF3168 domain-containing protein [uncultured Cohaesibacter sp.]